MGGKDRIIRIIVAIIALAFYFTGTGKLGIIALIITGIFLLTSFISFCPSYGILSLHTRSVK
jgi:hypothetical protein